MRLAGVSWSGVSLPPQALAMARAKGQEIAGIRLIGVEGALC